MPQRGALLVGLAALICGACLRFSPFQVDLDDAQRDQTSKNLAFLAQRPRAPVSAEAPLTFAFISDTHQGYRNFGKIVDAINARSDVELVLHGGDLTDFGTQQEYVWSYDIFSKLRVPYFEVAGNHDGLANGRILYGEMFGPENFDFSYAGVHFVFFNINTIEWHEQEPDLDFLERKVNEVGYEQTFVVTHQPPVSVPHLTASVTERLKSILEQARVDLYLYGHIHDGFAVEQSGPTRFVKDEAGLYGSWMLIRSDGEHYDFGACRFEDCSFDPLPDVAAGVDETMGNDE